jgi:ATP-dependent DNA helicase PIF1
MAFMVDTYQFRIEFIRMLNEVRYGKMSPGTVERFQSLSRPVEYSDGIEPTEL